MNIPKLKMPGMDRLIGALLMAAVIGYFAVGPSTMLHPVKVFAQASTGYTKINTAPVTGLTFNDPNVVDGATYQYEVTAFCSGTACGTAPSGAPILGESAPLVGNPLAVPATGTHSISNTWLASATPGVTYNVYRVQAVAPNPPGAVSGGVLSTVN